MAHDRGLFIPAGDLVECHAGGLECPGDAPRGWDILGGWLSMVLDCLSWPGEDGVTCVNGPTVLLRLVRSNQWASGLVARDIAEAVTGERFPVSAASISRRLWKRVGSPMLPVDDQINLIRLPGFFYQRAIPGQYDTVVKYDLSNAYGTIIARMPSPYVSVKESGEIKFKFRGLDRRAWSELQECSLRCKWIGRALYGSALGKSKKQRRWNCGQKSHQKLPPGPFFAFGNLVARIANEVTHLASDGTNACYGYTDCIVHGEGEGVPLWDLAGLPYREVSRGAGDVVNTVCYRVGEDMTEHYRCGVLGVVGHPNARYNSAIELVRGDMEIPQLFSSFLLVKGVS